ncbi:hypothetical protein A0H81_04385 [Grifola frondosa]|uniref:Family A G protein-coupled receptor-like protein n=1 Tax=Grifola frondosa TaxID=5627 RepID=A0A1C7MH74_GRIFR|nr:hypothetical protein A0H81_04385 [Grifola frondosa]
MSSLNQNPPNATRHITAHATDWLWFVFVVMILSALGMFFWAFSRPRGTRLFHQIAIIILVTASIAYFSMASDLGATPVVVEFRPHGSTVTRQIWVIRALYSRFITFPLLLIELLLATGLAFSDIFTTVFLAWVVVVCGLVGALVPSTYKWGYFTLGVVTLFFIWFVLLVYGPRSTFNAGAPVRTGYIRGSGYLVFLLLLYPIAVDYGAFGLASGKFTDGAAGAAGSGAGTGYSTGVEGGGAKGPGMTSAGISGAGVPGTTTATGPAGTGTGTQV